MFSHPFSVGVAAEICRSFGCWIFVVKGFLCGPPFDSGVVCSISIDPCMVCGYIQGSRVWRVDLAAMLYLELGRVVASGLSSRVKPMVLSMVEVSVTPFPEDPRSHMSDT